MIFFLNFIKSTRLLLFSTTTFSLKRENCIKMNLLHAQYYLSLVLWCGVNLHNPSYASLKTYPKLQCYQAEIERE